jgi:hypothetical protein
MATASEPFNPLRPPDTWSSSLFKPEVKTRNHGSRCPESVRLGLTSLSSQVLELLLHSFIMDYLLRLQPPLCGGDVRMDRESKAFRPPLSAPSPCWTPTQELASQIATWVAKLFS